ncbi:MAG: hypothetical protein LBD45_07945, partial [Bacteroidales bacterium]|nr:hypothetical protein [Bacteroidales bacterium]
MKLPIKQIFQKDHKIVGMIYFMFIILITHVLWKLTVHGNPHGHDVYFFGEDITILFYQVSLFTAKLSCWTLNNLLGQNFSLEGVN